MSRKERKARRKARREERKEMLREMEEMRGKVRCQRCGELTDNLLGSEHDHYDGTDADRTWFTARAMQMRPR